MVSGGTKRTTVSNILTQASCGSKGNVWGVDAAGNIYQYQSSDGGNTWTHTQIYGGLAQVSVAADGTVWGLNSAGYIERYNGNNSWTNIPGGLAQISVGSANLIWGVNSAGNIYQYNGSGWTMITGAFKQVSVASDGTVWGLDLAGNAYQYNGNNTWTQIPGHIQNNGSDHNGTFKLLAVQSASSVQAFDPLDTVYNRYSYYFNHLPTDWPWAIMGPSTITCLSGASDGTWLTIDQGVTTVEILL